MHLAKIRLADEILVVDPGGYVGESTAREIAYAESLGKPVSYLSRSPDGGVLGLPEAESSGTQEDRRGSVAT